jgi:hypothetical protein
MWEPGGGDAHRSERAGGEEGIRRSSAGGHLRGGGGGGGQGGGGQGGGAGPLSAANLLLFMVHTRAIRDAAYDKFRRHFSALGFDRAAFVNVAEQVSVREWV